MNEDRAVRYHRLRRRATVLSLVWTVLLLLGLLATGGHVQLATLAISVAAAAGPLAPPMSVAAYLACIGAIDQLVGLPLAFYAGYFLEHQYRLSTQSLGHWLRDYVKAAAVGLVLASGGLGMVYAAMERFPAWWWALSAGGLAAALVVLTHLGPVLVLPMFFRISPLDRPDLTARLVSLAGRAGTRVTGVYLWRLSDRTRKANAALTGLGRTRRILLSDTLVADFTDDEIEVVLAHELGHQVHRDLWTGIALEAAVACAGFYVTHRALRLLAEPLGLAGAADLAGLPLFLLTTGAVALLAVPGLNAVSRALERAADRFAVAQTGNPGAFVSAMTRLGSQNLAEAHPSTLVQWLFHTHPPYAQRIAVVAEDRVKNGRGR